MVSQANPRRMVHLLCKPAPLAEAKGNAQLLDHGRKTHDEKHVEAAQRVYRVKATFRFFHNHPSFTMFFTMFCGLLVRHAVRRHMQMRVFPYFRSRRSSHPGVSSAFWTAVISAANSPPARTTPLSASVFSTEA